MSAGTTVDVEAFSAAAPGPEDESTTWTHFRTSGDLGVHLKRSRDRGWTGLGDSQRYVVVALDIDGNPGTREVWTGELDPLNDITDAIAALTFAADQLRALARGVEGAS